MYVNENVVRHLIQTEYRVYFNDQMCLQRRGKWVGGYKTKTNLWHDTQSFIRNGALRTIQSDSWHFNYSKALICH